MPNRTRTKWLDEARDELRIRADLAGGRESVAWALRQLLHDVERRLLPRRTPPKEKRR